MWFLLLCTSIFIIVTSSYRYYTKTKLLIEANDSSEILHKGTKMQTGIVGRIKTSVQLDAERMKTFMSDISEMKKNYFRNSKKENLKKEYKHLYKKSRRVLYKLIFRNKVFDDFKNIYSELDHLVEQWNKQFIEDELVSNNDFFSNFDGKSLDEQQKEAVIVDEDHNLVIAGAGSGKTLTIAAKVKYLVEKRNINPEKILLLTFSRKAANEIKERINKRLELNVEAKTFHKLGLDIISKERGIKPDIFENMSQIIDNYFKDEIKNDPKILKDIIEFLGCYLNIPRDLEEFNNLGEVYELSKDTDLETIKHKIEFKAEELTGTKTTIGGEKVRSVEEVMIANFLYLNGIKYVYEKKYPHPTGDQQRRAYKPDFYLEDYDIYLEHFGITREGTTPWLSEVESEKYIEGIEWKRTLHKEKGTTLIETYSYYNKEGRLLIELDKILRSKGVEYHEVDLSKIYDSLYIKSEDRYFEEFKKLIETFIKLFKSRGYKEDDFNSLIKIVNSYKNNFIRERTLLFLSITKALFKKYQAILNERRDIDFNDMINLATDAIESSKVIAEYSYIIIDEYQDVSVSQFNLIKALRDQTDAIVMAVGDDWQSIYRFAGSDINLFTDFERRLGFTKTQKLEKTYRNSQELINVAGSFIMENSKQIRKKLFSDKHDSRPIKMFEFAKDISRAVKKAIEEIVYLYGSNTEIMFLGRTKYDIGPLGSDMDFEIKTSSGRTVLKYVKYPKLKMEFLTVHRAKGLEAENTIILNLENKLLGFPNKISDDPLLSLVLTGTDEFDYAEERRLFYVALTRSKNGTYLMVPDCNPSLFASELIKQHNIKPINANVVTGEGTIKENPNCPFCQTGYLVLRENKENKSKFLGCSNFPQCDQTFKNIELLDGYIKCSMCGGYMVKRNGKYGEFYGCTNYPICNYKLQIELAENKLITKSETLKK